MGNALQVVESDAEVLCTEETQRNNNVEMRYQWG